LTTKKVCIKISPEAHQILKIWIDLMVEEALRVHPDTPLPERTLSNAILWASRKLDILTKEKDSLKEGEID
jgi:hypothetical protein